MTARKPKRKTDEQRAFDWIRKRDNYNHYATFTAGIRSERRAMRKEIGEVLNETLQERMRVACNGIECHGIRLAMAALKIKENV